MARHQDVPLISIRALTKKFGGLTAVDGIDLDIFPAEITAIVGGNGAGKSTLIKMIAGSFSPTSGQISFKNAALPIADPLAVRRLGIETIYQDLALAELLDVPDNIFLGREEYKKRLGLRIIDKKFMVQESMQVLKRLKIDIPSLYRPIRTLSGGQRQGVSIGRAMYWNAEVIIMDEPTAALGVREKGELLSLLLDLKAKGVTSVIISHELRDVFAIADKIVVLYQGRCVAVKERRATDIEEIARLIITGGGN